MRTLNVKPHLILAVLYLAFTATKVFGAQALDPDSRMDIRNNIGFIHHPSSAMVSKFPICDAYLRVNWIDEEKKFGYSHYNYYSFNGKRKEALALIHIDEYYPHFDYDLREYQRKGHLSEIFSLIKQGKPYFNTSSVIIEGSRRPAYLQGNYDDRLGDFPSVEIGSFTKNKNTLCIPYPDDKRVWIADGKILDAIEVADDCGVSRGAFDYFTTDGKSMYLNNKCLLINPIPNIQAQ